MTRHVTVTQMLHEHRELDPEGLDPLRLLRLEPRHSETAWMRYPRFYWSSPDTGETLAGLGEVLGDGAARSSDLSRHFKLAGPAGDGLPTVAGMAFDADRMAGDTDHDRLWKGFSPMRATLCEVTLAVTPTRATLTILSMQAPEAVISRWADEIADALYTPTVRDETNLPLWLRAADVHLTSDEATALRERVVRAIAAIRRGEVDKVVVSSAKTVLPPRPLDPIEVLAALRARQPGCFQYLFQYGAYDAFVGATPERLVSVRHGRVRTMALAGSARRDADAETDRALGEALLASAKDRAEHAHVVDAIVRALGAAGVTDLTVPTAPRLRRLATIQHLETPIEGARPDGVGVLDLAARLHPTPALAGTPREAAMTLIRQLEHVDRGWYGGVVGWASGSGDGDLAVAIRCLLLRGDMITAFAGAGIVEGSDPDAEVREIELKLGAALGSLGPPSPGCHD